MMVRALQAIEIVDETLQCRQGRSEGLEICSFRKRSQYGFVDILLGSYLDSDAGRASCSRALSCESDVTFPDMLSRMPLDGPACGMCVSA
jgi:hypothetical protein